MARKSDKPNPSLWKKGQAPANPLGAGRKWRSFAIAIRRHIDPDEFAWWARVAAAGFDPDEAVEITDAITGELVEVLPSWKASCNAGTVVPPSRPGPGPDFTQRLRAWQMLLDRGLGQAPQHHIVEDQARADAARVLEASDRAMEKLSDAELAVLAKLGRATAEVRQLEGAVDADVVEDGEEGNDDH